MDPSYEEKIKQLGLEDQKIACSVIDMLYAKHIEQDKPSIILQLLNIMLVEMKYEKVVRMEDFKVIVADLKKLDGIKFINDNLDKLQSVKIDPIEDLEYEKRDKLKTYSINVLKGLVKIAGYKVESFFSHTKINNKNKSVFKYKLVKI